MSSGAVLFATVPVPRGAGRGSPEGQNYAQRDAFVYTRGPVLPLSEMAEKNIFFQNPVGALCLCCGVCLTLPEMTFPGGWSRGAKEERRCRCVSHTSAPLVFCDFVRLESVRPLISRPPPPPPLSRRPAFRHADNKHFQCGITKFGEVIDGQIKARRRRKWVGCYCVVSSHVLLGFAPTLPPAGRRRGMPAPDCCSLVSARWCSPGTEVPAPCTTAARVQAVRFD